MMMHRAAASAASSAALSARRAPPLRRLPGGVTSAGPAAACSFRARYASPPARPLASSRCVPLAAAPRPSHGRWRASAAGPAAGGGAGGGGGDTLVDIPTLVALLVDVADEAGRICKEVVASGDLGCVDKGGETCVTEDGGTGDYVADVQTEADRRSETMALAALSKHFPTVCVVAEESAGGAGGDDAPPTLAANAVGTPVKLASEAAAAAAAAPWAVGAVEASRIVVFIDPLDGTGEFASGNYPVVTNLFGVAVDGRPVAGVINQPFVEDPSAGPGGRTIWGGPGAGVHGIPLAPLPPAPPLVAVTNRVVRDTRIGGALEAVGAATVNRVSASGWMLLSLLEGSAHLMVVVRAGTKKWDTCAGEALLSASGGTVSDAAGRQYIYRGEEEYHLNLSGVIASRDASLHAAAIAALDEELGSWPRDVGDVSVVDA